MTIETGLVAVMDDLRTLRDAMHVRAVDEESRTITYRGMTDNIARDGGILRAEGMDGTNFDKNPMVMWWHGMTEETVPIVGRVTGRRMVEEGGVRSWDFDVQFAPRESSALAGQLFDLSRDGFAPAVSVGFQIKKLAELSAEEKIEMGLDSFGWVALEWELRELSLVPVGADPDALKRSAATNANGAGELAAEIGGLRQEIGALTRILTGAAPPSQVVTPFVEYPGGTSSDLQIQATWTTAGTATNDNSPETSRGDEAPETESAEEPELDENEEILRMLGELTERVAKRKATDDEGSDGGSPEPHG